MSDGPEPNRFEFKTCYGCGHANPHGLRLPLADYRIEDGEFVLDVTMAEHFAG